MALFKSKNQSVNTQIPELQEYYASQNKDSTVVAWLLAIGSLVVTVAVFIGLFMAGRWLYRSVTKTKSDNTLTTQSQDQKATDVNPAISTSPSQSPQTPNNSATINSGTVTVGQGSATSTAPGVSPSQSNQANQGSTAATTNIPNTGPGDVAVIFAVATIGGTMLYRRRLVKK